jgi:hypothetical protein
MRDELDKVNGQIVHALQRRPVRQRLLRSYELEPVRHLLGADHIIEAPAPRLGVGSPGGFLFVRVPEGARTAYSA